MDQLDLVWELEQDIKLLDKYREELDILKSDIEGKKLAKNLKEIELELKEKINLKNNIQSNIRSTEKNLMGLNYDLSKIEKELYNGEISDIQQLEYLNEKKSEISEIIDLLENELINNLELADNNLDYIDKIKEKKLKLESRSEDFDKTLLVKLEEKNSLIRKQEDKIDTLSGKIDKGLLNSYKNIKKHFKLAIVEASGGICTGCNMMLSSSLWDQVKNNKEINYCEHCNRILYYKE